MEFTKSSHSGADADCVQVKSFRKSSWSGNGGNCVEVAPVDGPASA